MIFFSVIIPTYNSLKLLKKAILSLEKQNFKNFETIVVDDGSTDGTMLFLKKYKKKKINLKFFSSKRFGGPAKPRNIGIKKSNGKWICFLDSDDFWFPKKLYYLKNFIKNSNKKYDIYHHNELLISKKKQKIINYKTYKNNYYLNLLLNGNNLSPSASVINKDFINKHNLYFTEVKKFISIEDYDFWLRAALKGAKFKYIKEVLGVYNIHDKNLTSDLLAHKKKNIYLIYNHIFKSNFNFNLKKKIWRKIYLTYLIEIEIVKCLNYNKFFSLIVILKIIFKRPMSLLFFFKKKFS